MFHKTRWRVFLSFLILTLGIAAAQSGVVPTMRESSWVKSLVRPLQSHKVTRPEPNADETSREKFIKNSSDILRGELIHRFGFTEEKLLSGDWLEAIVFETNASSTPKNNFSEDRSLEKRSPEQPVFFKLASDNLSYSQKLFGLWWRKTTHEATKSLSQSYTLTDVPLPKILTPFAKSISHRLQKNGLISLWQGSDAAFSLCGYQTDWACKTLGDKAVAFIRAALEQRASIQIQASEGKIYLTTPDQASSDKTQFIAVSFQAQDLLKTKDFSRNSKTPLQNVPMQMTNIHQSHNAQVSIFEESTHVTVGAVGLRPQDVFKPVSALGRVPVDMAVSPSGQLSMQLPIELSVGGGHLTPALQISYQPGSGDGVLGKDMVLSGLSMITRCRRVRGISGLSALSDLDMRQDDLCLDGSRLILLSGAYFKPGSIYGIQGKPGARATYQNNQSIQVYLGDGQRLTFGASVYHRTTYQNTILDWHLSETKDNFGNYFKVSYLGETHQLKRPKQIDYGFTKQSGATHTIHFSYTIRTRPITRYRVGGGVASVTHQLKEIALYRAGQDILISRYRFAYQGGKVTDKGLASAQLVGVQRCGLKGGSCLKPTEFAWSQPSAQYKTREHVALPDKNWLGIAPDEMAELYGANAFAEFAKRHKQYRFYHALMNHRVLDLNGDGLLDIVLMHKAALNSGRYGYYLGQSQGDFGAFHLSDVPVPKAHFQVLPLSMPGRSAQGFLGWRETGWYFYQKDSDTGQLRAQKTTLPKVDADQAPQLVDIDGDMREDFVVGQQYYLNLSTRDKVKFSAAKTFDLKYTDAMHICKHYGSPESRLSILPDTVADVNGDGLYDPLVQVSCHSLLDKRNREIVWLFYESAQGTHKPGRILGREYFHHTPDSNNPDLLPQWADWQLVKNDISTKGRTYRTGERVDSIQVGDVNGDGLLDLIVQKTFPKDDTFLYFNTGDGFKKIQRLGDYTKLGKGLLVTDFNGDGLADIGYVTGLTGDPNKALLENSKTTWWVRYSAGDHLIETPQRLHNRGVGRVTTLQALGDYNGDGGLDILVVDKKGVSLHSREGMPANLLLRARDGLGAETRAEFMPMTRNVHEATKDFRQAVESRDGILDARLTDGVGEFGVCLSQHSNDCVVSARPMTRGPWLVKSLMTLQVPTHLRFVHQIPVKKDNLLKLSSYRYYGGILAGGGVGFLGFSHVDEYDLVQENLTKSAFFVAGELAGQLITRRDIYLQTSDMTDSAGHYQIKSADWLGTRKQVRYQYDIVRAKKPGLVFIYPKETVIEKFLPTDRDGNGVILDSTRVLTQGFTDQQSRTNDGRKGYLSEINETVTDETGKYYTSSRHDYSHFETGEQTLFAVYGRVQETSVTKHSDALGFDSDSITRVSQFAYGHRGELIKSTAYVNSAAPLQTIYTHNTCGQRNSKTLKSLDTQQTQLVWQRDYDASCESLIKTRDSLGNETRYTAHPVLGIRTHTQLPSGVTKETLINGLGVKRGALVYDANGQRQPKSQKIQQKYVTSADKHQLNNPRATWMESTLIDGKERSRRYFDIFDREIAVATKREMRFAWAYKMYDLKGQLTHESEPTFYQTDNAVWTQKTYDRSGRVLSIKRPYSTETWSYPSASKVTKIDALGNMTTVQKNTEGHVISQQDTLGQRLTYYYDALGQKRAMKYGSDQKPIKLAYDYDARGNLIREADPNRGEIIKSYTAFNQLKSETDALGIKVLLSYDALGRVLTKRTPEQHIDYQYGAPNTTAYKQLTQKTYHAIDSARPDLVENYHYDHLSRLIALNTQIGHKKYDSALHYAKGLLAKRCLPGDICVQYEYDATDRLKTTTAYFPSSEQKRLFVRDNLNARGQITRGQFGNGKSLSYERDDYGRVVHLRSGDYLADYAWDALGNLATRSIQVSHMNYQEDFEYDALNRLTNNTLQVHSRTSSSQTKTPADQMYHYDDLGNLYRLDVGRFQYDDAMPHALKKIQRNDGTETRYQYNLRGERIETQSPISTEKLFYTRLGQLHGLARHKSGQSYQALYAYTDQNDRYFEQTVRSNITHSDTKTVTTTHRVGNTAIHYDCDIEQIDCAPRFEHAIDGHSLITQNLSKNITAANEARTAHAILDESAEQSHSKKPAIQVHALHRDVLGSVVAISDGLGQVIQTRDYDPWGKLRVPMVFNDITQENRQDILHDRDVSSQADHLVAKDNDALQLTDVSFTGQRAIRGTDLIHYRGRIYDPTIGRFTSADPLIDTRFGGQGLNRYSYVQNNPLRYTDPSGYFLHKIIPAKFQPLVAIGLSILTAGMGATLALSMVVGAATGYMMTGTLKGAVIGAISAGVTHGIGALKGYMIGQGSSMRQILTTQMALRGLAGGLMQRYTQNGSFMAGFISGTMNAYTGLRNYAADSVPSEILIQSIVGGVTSKLSGGKFMNGALTSAFTTAFSFTAGAPKNPSSDDGVDYGWFRPKGHDYFVGRDDHMLVWTGKEGPGIGSFIDDYIPAGHTFGVLHDAFIDVARWNQWPDILVNVPSMFVYYPVAVLQEFVNMSSNISNTIFKTQFEVPFPHSHPRVEQ